MCHCVVIVPPSDRVDNILGYIIRLTSLQCEDIGSRLRVQTSNVQMELLRVQVISGHVKGVGSLQRVRRTSDKKTTVRSAHPLHLCLLKGPWHTGNKTLAVLPAVTSTAPCCLPSNTMDQLLPPSYGPSPRTQHLSMSLQQASTLFAPNSSVKVPSHGPYMNFSPEQKAQAARYLMESRKKWKVARQPKQYGVDLKEI